jgi:hypothetical protein
MHYRLGEYECDECGGRHLAAALTDDEKLPVRRASEPTPGYRPAGGGGFVDNSVGRGTRQR